MRDLGRHLPRESSVWRTPRRRFDIVGVVEQHKRLQRRIRPRAIDHTLFARRGVEGQQARVQERTLPVGIKAATIPVWSLVGGPVALGKIEKHPVAGRLVRFDARSADFLAEQP